MTALTTTTSPAFGADWSRWVDVSYAAAQLGISVGHLKRRCDVLKATGLAMFDRHPDGGPARWWISRDYDVRLQHVIGELHQEPSLEEQGVPRDKADEARQWKACVMRLRAARRDRVSYPGLQADWLPRLLDELRQQHPTLTISRSTLLRKDSLYRRPADLIKLVDKRGGATVDGADAKAWAYFERLYLDDRRPTVAECHRLTAAWAAEQGLRWCALRTCQLQLDGRIPPAKQAFHRDRDLYNSRFLPTLAQDVERFKAGRCWVFDHTTLDLFCRAGEQVFRPYITAALDWRTRKIVGWALSRVPNSDTILLTLREGLLDPSNMGGPEEVCFDNGKDFDAVVFDGRTKKERQRRVSNDWASEGTFRGIFGDLNITPHFSIAYAPNGKARMERWFGTLHDQFDRTWPTYCGPDTASKPDGLAERMADLRNVPTIDELHERFDRYVAAYNANADHQITDLADRGVRLSPSAAMQTWCTEVRAFDRGALELCLLHHGRDVTVGKQGVGITVAGRLWYFGLSHGALQPELLAYQGTGRKVRCAYDPRDLRTVRVFDAQTKSIVCDARSNDFGGMQGPVGRQFVAEWHRGQRQHHKQLEAAGLGRVMPRLSAREQLALGVDLPDIVEPSTRTIKPVRTGFEEAAKDAQRHDLKKAAGAEHDEAPAPRRGLPDLEKFLSSPPLSAREDDDAVAPLARIGDDAPPPPEVAPAPEPVVIDDADDEDGMDPFSLLERLDA